MWTKKTAFITHGSVFVTSFQLRHVFLPPQSCECELLWQMCSRYVMIYMAVESASLQIDNTFQLFESIQITSGTNHMNCTNAKFVKEYKLLSIHIVHGWVNIQNSRILYLNIENILRAGWVAGRQQRHKNLKLFAQHLYTAKNLPNKAGNYTSPDI